MKNVSDVAIKYVLGIVIAALLAFLFWYLFLHTEPERIAEKSAQDFLNALDLACKKYNDGDKSPVEVDIELRQLRTTSVLEEIKQGFENIFGVKVPFQEMNDPYFYLYWEYFPPDDAYKSLGGAAILGQFFAPWTEDLPWSSNMFTTLVFSTLFLGMDLLDIKEAKNIAKEAANEIAEKAEPLKEVLEKGGEITNKVGKKVKVIVDAGKIAFREGKFILKVAGAYSIFCFTMQDKTLGQCLGEGLVVGFAAEGLKIVGRKMASKLSNYINLEGVKTSLSNLAEKLSRSVDDSIDENFDDIIKNQGFTYEIDDLTGKIKTTDEKVLNLMDEYLDENNYPRTPGSHTIDIEGMKVEVEFDNNGNLKEVRFKKESIGSIIKDKINKKIIEPIKNHLAKLEEKVFYNEVLTPEGYRYTLESAKKFFENDYDRAAEFLKKADPDLYKKVQEIAAKEGISVGQAASRYITSVIDDTLDRYKDGNFIAVIAKDSRLANTISEISEEGHFYQKMSSYIRGAIYDNDEAEIKRFWNLINGQRTRLTDDIETFLRSNVGHSILHLADIYTPVGATYWDKFFSFYGFKAKEAPKEYCQTSCAYGYVCLNLGACVRRFELPESCQQIGISSIRLKRGSVVAGNPRFYLVSPCNAKLKIYIENYNNEKTIFVEPYLKSTDTYCYATAGLVNAWVGSEVGEKAASCAAGLACVAILAGSTGGIGAIGALDGILACVGIKVPGVCNLVQNLVQLGFDVSRESLLVWPSVYKNFPNLIDFKA